MHDKAELQPNMSKMVKTVNLVMQKNIIKRGDLTSEAKYNSKSDALIGLAANRKKQQ